MSILQIFQNPVGFLREMLVLLPAIIVALTVHEFAHGLTAFLMGDNTAKYQGRMSLNPMRHIDPFGLLMLILFRFGWAKPVQVDPSNYKHPKLGMALTALGGPIMNFITAFILNIVFVFSKDGLISMYNGGGALSSLAFFLFNFLNLTIFININLGVFNLIPIFPLDGSKVLYAFLPAKWYFKVLRYEQYGFIIIILLLAFGILTIPLSIAQNLIYYMIINPPAEALAILFGIL